MRASCFPVLVIAVLLSWAAAPQTAQVGADAGARGGERLEVAYVHYRPARWETERVKEFESEFPNKGGLVYVYFRNVSDEPVDLRYWRVNKQDESYWRLNHFVAWDRHYRPRLEPGQYDVLEINATTKDFREGAEFDFSYVDRSWKPAVRFNTTLTQDPVVISCIRVLPGMRDIETHVRYTGSTPIAFEDIEVVGHPAASVEWASTKLAGAGQSIARVKLDAPLSPSELLMLRLKTEQDGKTRDVFAHRRAFEDYFPIGTWSGKPETYGLLRRLHIDTIVKGGHSADPFYSGLAQQYGFRTMVHTGLPVNVDTVRDLGAHPAVACWMLQDEPDWSIPANIMLFADRSVRHYDQNKPTFITLCRNTKFFEYAPIADIPCQDHYAVTAPSSSKWPKFYGTRLEETAWYTRDLKYASEPKPIWVWSQAIADWDERPKRPVPTPAELAAQLVLNLGRGAKGILWFNYDHKVAEKYPDVREAMRGWGRVLGLLRDDFLASEAAALEIQAPKDIDVAALVTWDKLILCLCNTDYEIHPEAYPFVAKRDVRLEVALPPWLNPGTACRVTPQGIEALDFETGPGVARVSVGALDVCAIVVLARETRALEEWITVYKTLLEEEKREF